MGNSVKQEIAVESVVTYVLKTTVNSNCKMLLAFVFSTFLLVVAAQQENQTVNYHEYCVIGAGPGGLQMGYFLKSSKRDYIIYEKGKGWFLNFQIFFQ